MTELDLEQKLAFVTRATRDMALHTFPFIATVAAVESETSGFAVGSAVRVRDGSRRWVVTAAHVVDEAMRRTGRLAVAAVRGAAPVVLAGEPVRDHEADLCAFAVGTGFPDVAFWDLEERDDVDLNMSRDFLFVHGFPQTRGHFSPMLEALLTRSFPYGAMRREDDLPPDLATFQVALEFEAATLRGLDGEVAEPERPNGLSGSPVWRIGAAWGRASDWSPASCKLVGVLTQWRPKDELLVASGVGRLAAMLRRA